MFSFPYYCVVSILSRIVWVIRKCQNFFQWFIDLNGNTSSISLGICQIQEGLINNHLPYFCDTIPPFDPKIHFFVSTMLCDLWYVTTRLVYLIIIIFYSAELSLSDWRKCSFCCCCCFWASAIEEIHPSAILVSFLPLLVLYIVSFKLWPLDLPMKVRNN